MATVHIDGEHFSVDGSKNLLEVALELGFDLPYFCWHPALGSVGACRQCAVKQYKDESDTTGKLVMACMTPASDGTRVAIHEDDAVEFRRSITEWLMVNHPHDCPICDEGGECHLQDMTVMTGHAYRRYRFKKRTYKNQDLGPHINHEMNRCIQCYRCVRFYSDHAGGRDLKAFSSHDHVYFGRDRDGPLESIFSGNLVEICPTGVFTDKTLKSHYVRKWDLQTAPSVCAHCSLGCNITPGERYGTIRRVRARYNNAVNGYFICDRGRFGYAAANDERRLSTPLVPHGTDRPAEVLDADAAIRHLKGILSNANGVIGIGSPHGSVEDNFVLRKLVGPGRFYQPQAEAGARRLDRILEILRTGPARTPSLRETERADAVLVLGEDVTETAPMLALALRQAARVAPKRRAAELGIDDWHDAAVREVIQNETGPVFIVAPEKTALDDVARESIRLDGDGIARLGFAVAHALDPAAPDVSDLSDEERDRAARIAGALSTAERPLVVAGTRPESDAILEAAANVAWACRAAAGRCAGLSYVVPHCNSVGLAMLGAQSADAAMDALASGQADTIVLFEPGFIASSEPAEVGRLFDLATHTVVLDSTARDAASRASLLLPAATSFEGHGTFVNNEGRAQRYFRVFPGPDPIREGWRWLGSALDEPAFSGRLADLHRLLAEDDPALEGVGRASPPADLRVHGRPIARQPYRYSGRTAMHVHLQIHEQPPVDDPDSPFRFSMEGAQSGVPGRLASEFWAPGFNSIQALNRFQEEIAGPLRGGDGGVRLIEPDEQATVSYFDARAPAASAGRGRERAASKPVSRPGSVAR